jgi:hypothetical protein
VLVDEAVFQAAGQRDRHMRRKLRTVLLDRMLDPVLFQRQ